MDDELRQLLETMRQENAAAIVESRRHSEQLAAATRQHSEQLAAATRQHSEQMAAGTRQHSDDVAAEMRRHFEVVAERLETKIELVAEGVVACNERIDRLETKVDHLAVEMAKEFNDVRSMIKFSHHELDRRLRTLEEIVSDLQARVERLESATH